MNPLGQTIQFWRTKKGLTQAMVAERSGVSRPNLSAIEQGARDLTVQTLRRIATTLGVSPGALVDGVSSESNLPKLDRYALDRIARMASGQSLKASDTEKRIARDLASVMKSKTRKPSFKKDSLSEETRLWQLKSELSPKIFEHLIRRVEKNLANHHE